MNIRRLLLALLLVAPTAFPASAQITYSTIALTGQAAAGTLAGTTFTGFIWPVINSSGNVAFTASLSGAGVVHTNDSGIWTISAGSLGLVARAGNTAPGSSQNFNNMFGIGIVLDSSNNVAFGDSVLNAAGAISGSGIWSGAPSSLGVVALSGMHAPATSGTANFNSFGTPNDSSGLLLFQAGLTGSDTQGSNSGIWSFQGNTFQLVARTGFGAPNTEAGTVFSQFYNDIINPAQVVAFVADLRLTNGTDRGICRGLPSSLSLVARRNTAAAGTNGVFTNFNIISMNAANSLLFDGSWGNANGSTAGLWFASAATPAVMTLVAQVGSPAPGTGGAVFAQFYDHYVGGNDRIVLLARDTTNTSGIWTGPATALNLVAHEGSVAPGTNGAHFSALSVPEINAAGQVAFFATLDTGAQSIWATDLTGTLQLIALQGAAFTVAPGDVRQISFLTLQAGGSNEDGLPSSFNDAGVIAFHAIFTDNTAGVFTAAVSAPLPPSVSIRRNSTNATVQFSTNVAHNYYVEYTNSLTTPNWQMLGSAVAGTGAVQTVTDSSPGTKRFYHVVEQ